VSPIVKQSLTVQCQPTRELRFDFRDVEAMVECPAIEVVAYTPDGEPCVIPSVIPVNERGFQTALSLSTLFAQVAQEIEQLCKPANS
jgi:hypothetical protein